VEDGGRLAEERRDGIYSCEKFRFPSRIIISIIMEMNLPSGRYFNMSRNMKKPQALAGLSALAQENRLDTFRLLVQAGSAGMPAGQVASALGLPPNTLTFHFDRLREAGLVTVRREGRSMIYAANYQAMNALLDYLTENCCKGAASDCSATTCQPTALTKRVRERA
jgi:ArsR family transcriptional regulator